MPTKTASVTCGFQLATGPCTKKTKDPSGRCHLHRGAGQVTAPGDAAEAAATAASAQPFTDQSISDPVAWLPDDGLEPGRPLGHTLLVADGDIEDGVVVAQSYLDPGGGNPAEVLHLKLTPEAEDRMLDALGLAGGQTKLVTKQIETAGIHPADSDAQLHHQVGVMARSYNARLKNGEPVAQIRDANQTRIVDLEAALADVQAKAGDDPGTQAMLAHYQAQFELLTARMNADTEPPPYTEGGKLALLEQWTGPYTTTVTEEVPVDNPDLGAATLPTAEVQGKRLSTEMTDGKSQWARGAYTKADCPEKMWKVDLGDGYTALYYPDSLVNKKGWAQKRRMTVIAPATGDAAGALERMERLHLSGQPMRPAQAEFSYLERNLYALGQLDHPEVQKARVEAADYAQALAAQRVTDRLSETIGMDAAQQREWVRTQRTAAEAEALPYRAKRLRDATAKVCGYASGDALAKHPSYRPAPTVGPAGATFDRFAPSPTATDGGLTDKSFSHQGNSAMLGSIIRSGALVSTVRRRQMGAAKNVGMSEAADVNSGGASAVFARITNGPVSKPNASGGGFVMHWSGQQAAALGRRTDWYATKGDHFGATNPNDIHYKSGMTRQTHQVQGWNGGEMMFEGSIGLTTHPPTWIDSGSMGKTAAVAAFHKEGIYTFADGRKVEDVVI